MFPLIFLSVVAALSAILPTAVLAQTAHLRPNNVILFVADGLRYPVVDNTTAPTMTTIARDGVALRNSHALFPTLTTANASAMATGHMLGDTGDFSNTVFAGFEVFSAHGTLTPFLESDSVIGEIDAHFSGDYLNENTILKLARESGYSTAAVGKTGPTLIFDHQERTGDQTIIFDDATGSLQGIPLSESVQYRIREATLPFAGTAGDDSKFINSAKSSQLNYYAAVATQVILPIFKERNKPFILIFWSRDPDLTQHNQRDSLNEYSPGINGATSIGAIQKTDNDLAAIRIALKQLDLLQTTDIIVTADHGFSTISKESETSSTVETEYNDTLAGQLPVGFLALDLARSLKLPLNDPDDDYRLITGRQHPKFGNGVIGGDRNKPKLIVAANGGSDLIYISDRDKALTQQVINILLSEDYVSGIFVDSKVGKFSGTLALDDIALEGSAVMPTPSIVVSFRSFDTICGEPERCAVEVADTVLQQGQGTHGSFSRADTWNFMAMQGPDFKSHFIDSAPVSTADLGRTIAYLMKFDVGRTGKLVGRVLSETFPDGVLPEVTGQVIVSEPSLSGTSTVVNAQSVGNIRYFDVAGFPGRTVGLSTTAFQNGPR